MNQSDPMPPDSRRAPTLKLSLVTWMDGELTILRDPPGALARARAWAQTVLETTRLQVPEVTAVLAEELDAVTHEEIIRDAAANGVFMSPVNAAALAFTIITGDEEGTERVKRSLYWAADQHSRWLDPEQTCALAVEDFAAVSGQDILTKQLRFINPEGTECRTFNFKPPVRVALRAGATEALGLEWKDENHLCTDWYVQDCEDISGRPGVPLEVREQWQPLSVPGPRYGLDRSVREGAFMRPCTPEESATLRDRPPRRYPSQLTINYRDRDGQPAEDAHSRASAMERLAELELQETRYLQDGGDPGYMDNARSTNMAEARALRVAIAAATLYEDYVITVSARDYFEDVSMTLAEAAPKVQEAALEWAWQTSGEMGKLFPGAALKTARTGGAHALGQPAWTGAVQGPDPRVCAQMVRALGEVAVSKRGEIRAALREEIGMTQGLGTPEPEPETVVYFRGLECFLRVETPANHAVGGEELPAVAADTRLVLREKVGGLVVARVDFPGTLTDPLMDPYYARVQNSAVEKGDHPGLAFALQQSGLMEGYPYPDAAAKGEAMFQVAGGESDVEMEIIHPGLREKWESARQEACRQSELSQTDPVQGRNKALLALYVEGERHGPRVRVAIFDQAHPLPDEHGTSAADRMMNDLIERGEVVFVRYGDNLEECPASLPEPVAERRPIYNLEGMDGVHDDAADYEPVAGMS